MAFGIRVGHGNVMNDIMLGPCGDPEWAGPQPPPESKKLYISLKLLIWTTLPCKNTTLPIQNSVSSHHFLQENKCSQNFRSAPKHSPLKITIL